MTSTALQAIPTVEGVAYPTRYAALRTAIAACHQIDECKEISDRATAMATYYKQIRDDESVRKYREIRLRSWRRIGALLGQIDCSSCATQVARVALIRETSSDPTTGTLKDHEIIRALKLAALPEAGFEEALDEADGSFDRMIALADPKMIAERAEADRRRQEQAERIRQQAIRDEATLREQRTAALTRQAERIRGDQGADELVAGTDDEEREVGLTLNRHFKRRMKVVNFYLPAEAHEQLRKAAFDRRITMHEALRQALDMWFRANGLPMLANE